MDLQKYNKLWVALGAALAQVAVVLNDTVSPNVITTSEWVTVAIAFVGALGVYAIANT